MTLPVGIATPAYSAPIQATIEPTGVKYSLVADKTSLVADSSFLVSDKSPLVVDKVVLVSNNSS